MWAGQLLYILVGEASRSAHEHADAGVRQAGWAFWLHRHLEGEVVVGEAEQLAVGRVLALRELRVDIEGEGAGAYASEDAS